ncbi:MAG: AraC family transcriptional regulator [Bacteroidales bacterium]|nr:AraC family transcriptional regulator [Bacteroidales bacterium]
MEQEYKNSLFFQYSNIFFSYYFNNDTRCSKMVHEHSLTYVYGGEMIIEERGNKTVIGKGECAFIKRDNRILMTKQAKDGEHYKGIFMSFTRNCLREFYQKLNKSGIPENNSKFQESVIKLPQIPEVESLFHSMTPYFSPEAKPREEFMQLKLQEGIYALLNIDKKFYPTLFDFTEPWKIDILEFLNENYMCDLTLDEIANFTGRSLATFKRDFKKISDLTPQKWLIHKRLETAHDMIKYQNKKVKDACMDVGFKNLSHFSKIYKEMYGLAPTK